MGLLGRSGLGPVVCGGGLVTFALTVGGELFADVADEGRRTSGKGTAVGTVSLGCGPETVPAIPLTSTLAEEGVLRMYPTTRTPNTVIVIAIIRTIGVFFCD